MEEGYFSIKRDMETVRAGGFFCQGCLVGKPLDDQSSDPRYCLSCYEFLLDEAVLLSPNRGKPSWVPVPSNKHQELSGGATPQQEQRQDVAKPCTKGIIPPATPEGVLQHGGRPRKKGEVHRTTEWRRKKAQEVQGVLV